MRNSFQHRWKLQVEAIGYWFTSGGVKGSFGYYPHLKELIGEKVYPVYPDTQVLGNLKAAAYWLSKLKPEVYPRDFVSLVFGDPNTGTETVLRPSKIFVTDLCLADRSKWETARFQIKPKIEVGDNRTVKEHMLMNFEAAYLEGLELEADIYLVGNFEEEEFEKAKQLVEESINYIPGFGAFRSRGFGRGYVSIKTIEIEPNMIYGDSGNLFLVRLTSLVNFRNRQVEPGKKQVVTSNPIISKDKFKAWLLRTYKDRYQYWLDIGLARKVICSSFRPVPNDYYSITVPPPISSLKNEQGDMLDLCNLNIELNENENFFATKASALTGNMFLTNETDPKIYEVPIARRVRNSLDETFKTLSEGGLFVQEFIPAGIKYAGILEVQDDGELKQNIFNIISKDLALINGCIFRIEVIPFSFELVKANESKTLLVTEPVPLLPELNLINYRESEFVKVSGRFIKQKANQIRLSTYRSYVTSLNRPRRPRITVAPGSVVHHISNPESLSLRNFLAWKGFGKKFGTKERSEEEKVEVPKKIREPFEKVTQVAESLLKDGITRS
ncbi:MAG: hypothetical protein QXZ09_08775, partial [Candidatus Methanomethylicaceae archaeon]